MPTFPVLVLGVFVALAAPASAQTEADERAASNRLYTDAQLQLERGNHERARTLFEEYLDFTKTRAHRPERVFAAIDRVASLYLGVERDPDGALAFFGRIEDDPRLTDLDRSAIGEWIAVASEWKQERAKIASGLHDATALFERGKRYYESGIDKQKSGISYFSNADFNVAAGYLRRFAILHDRHPRIGDAIHMLGAIRFYTRSEDSDWSDNFYLKESIRRFPHTPLAARSYDLLKRGVSRFYKPTEVPRDLAEDLSHYEALARPAAPTA